MKLLTVVLSAVVLSGCANSSSMYKWGNYDAMLYQSYKNPEKVLELQQMLETHIANMEQSKLKVSPGLYAELGTIYMQSGDSARAIGMYAKERDAWPESKRLMDAMISNIGRTIKAKPEVKS